MNCPLCSGNETKVLESVGSKELVKQYKSLTGVGFTYLLDRDIEYRECQNCKLRYFDPLITGDEKFYNSLQKFDWYYPDEKEEFLEAVKFISSSDRVLEVGSGRGAFVSYLPTQQYVGLDFSKKAKEMAEKNGIIIKNESIQDYSEKNPNSCDVVVSFQVLEHVPNPRFFLAAKVKALKVGGKMIVAVPSEDSFLKYVSNNILNMPPHHVTRWNDNALRSISDIYDLELVGIYHEKVQGIHKLYYLTTLIQSTFLTNKLIDNSFSRKLVSKLSGFLSRRLVTRVKGEMLPNGHNVLAVYRKVR